MPPMLRVALAIVAAGVVGAIANAVALSLALDDASFWALATNPVRLAVAIAVAAMLPPIHRALPAILEGIVALAALTLVPSLLAKWAFGAPAPWGVVLIFNMVYAGFALVTYRFVREWGRDEHD